ncbi:MULTISPECIES: cell division regulator GpsB [Bacillus cereus group]|uniref:cell division regulator GpsB n=1 Tax=Bacillus cereus group TaxID=86661 RepID=UPI000BF20B39|nr:cell division regulator GpsB [Bacillus wiedmannii]MCU5704969.1 cell division regulator GpsB [Bacillus wiedmannii]PEJ76601.1 cell division regulator GpsB [Bacillus wiedmannii]PHA01741.1 cell division regulator GpsB [Bacillus wiedmannii]PHA31902.1 cell division regulator GpsB [Bacillus wiedmannii]PHG54647.1 cell division regulator GpsB [Bacillus wiedmannii]
MISDKIKLTAKDILEKEFKTGMRGYQQEEVDKFLDMIIKDYEAFHKEFDQLKQQNARLKRELEEQKLVATQVPQQPVVPTPVAQPVYNNTNTDILKRLSNLEKAVFGSKLYE